MRDLVGVVTRSKSTRWLAVGMSVPMLAVGAVTDTGLLLSVAAVAIAAAFITAVPRMLPATLSVRLATAGLAVLIVATAFQLVPLPPPVLRALSPHAAEIWQSADATLGSAPRYRPLTLDIHGTAFALATLVLATSWFLICQTVGATSSGRRKISLAIVAVVSLFYAIAIAHPLLRLTTLYGVVEPVGAVERLVIVPPLLNANHAAALACVGPPLLLGVALETDRRDARVAAGFLAAIGAAVVALTFSRGGVTVLALELLAFVVWAAIRRRATTALALAVGAVVASGVAIVVFGMDRLRGELANRDFSKLEIARAAVRMSKDFRWTGAGANAFASAFAGYEGELGGVTRHSHTENWPTQWLVDYGVIVSCIAAALLLAAVIVSARAALREPLSAASIIALVGLVVHDLFDFALSFASVALTAVALLAVVTSSPRSRARRASRRVPRIPLVLAPVCGMALLAIHFGHSVDSDSQVVAAGWKSGSLRTMKKDIDAAIQRHPAEPYFALTAAISEFDTPHAAVHFLRAAQLGPFRAQTHYFLARWFVSMNRRPQGLAEYRAALHLAPSYVVPVVDDLIKFEYGVDDIVAAADAPHALDYAARALDTAGRGDDARHVDEVLLSGAPESESAATRHAYRLHRTGDSEGARRVIRKLLELKPKSIAGRLALVRIAPSPAEAENLANEGLSIVGDDADLLAELVRVRGTRLGLDAIAGERSRLRDAASAKGMIALSQRVEGEVALARGDVSTALGRYELASDSPGGTLSDLEMVGVLSERLGRLARARVAWRRLCDLAPSETRYKEALARVEGRLNVVPEPTSQP